MTNSYNDEQNSKCILFFGSNAAEAHPVSMMHTLHAKENGAKVIVVDPRFTRTAAKADKYYRIRSGTDVAFLMGMLHHIFKNGWEDKEYIKARVYGMDKVREEAAKWTPEKVEEVTGMKEAEVRDVAETHGQEQAQHHRLGDGPDPAHQRQRDRARVLHPAAGARATSASRAAAATSTAATTTCRARRTSARIPIRCPAITASRAGSWKHFAAVWGVDYEWIKKQFASQAMMEKPGITVSRWIDAVLEKNENLDQDPNLRAVVYWGHAPNSQTRGKEMVEAMKKLDLLVVVDPYPSATAAMAAMVRQDGAYLLPAATQLECAGSVTRFQPLDPVARKSDRADVRVAHRPHDHVPACAEVRLRARSSDAAREDQARRRARAAWTSPTWRTRCARSTAAAGPSATPASRPSGCRRTCATCTYST